MPFVSNLRFKIFVKLNRRNLRNLRPTRLRLVPIAWTVAPGTVSSSHTNSSIIDRQPFLNRLSVAIRGGNLGGQKGR